MSLACTATGWHLTSRTTQHKVPFPQLNPSLPLCRLQTTFSCRQCQEVYSHLLPCASWQPPTWLAARGAAAPPPPRLNMHGCRTLRASSCTHQARARKGPVATRRAPASTLTHPLPIAFAKPLPLHCWALAWILLGKLKTVIGGSPQQGYSSKDSSAIPRTSLAGSRPHRQGTMRT